MRLEYNASEAFDLIMNALREANPDLAERAQIAIDAGIDQTVEQDVRTGRGRRSKTSKREYRENRPLTEAESIDVVLEVLEAHLIVHRRVVNEAVRKFEQAALGNLVGQSEELDSLPSAHQSGELPAGKSKPGLTVEVLANTVGSSKSLEVVLLESARKPDDKDEVKPLLSTSEDELGTLQELIDAIRHLTRFED